MTALVDGASGGKREGERARWVEEGSSARAGRGGRGGGRGRWWVRVCIQCIVSLWLGSGNGGEEEDLWIHTCTHTCTIL